jgi:hypothetical protein
MKDLFNNITVMRAIAPVSVADNTAQVGAIIDRQGFNSLTFAISLGSLTDADATFAVTIDHGDNAALSDAAAVPAGDLLGTTALANFTFADDNLTRKIGYRGTRRYVRLTITPANNTLAALFGAVALLGHPHAAPASNP